MPAWPDPQLLRGFLLSVLRLWVWLILVAAVFVPLERVFAARPRAGFGRSLPGDLGFYFLNGLLPNLLLAAPLAVLAYVSFHLVPWRLHAMVAAWPLWLRGLAAFVVGDFGFYWGHRWAHRIPLLWRFHAVHHHPRELYFLVSSRAHPVDFMFIRLIGLTPIYILGLGAPESVQGTLVATLIMLAVTVWGFFIHANLRWRFGVLEWLVATPAFHHWHHTRHAPADRNFASMLPCMDLLFGTLHLPRRTWPEAYGIRQDLPATLGGQLLQPFLPDPVPDPVPDIPAPDRR